MRTWLIPVGTLHVRVHRVQTSRPLWSSDAGFTVGYRQPAELSSTSGGHGELALAVPDGQSAVRDLAGDRTVEQVLLEPNAHVSFPLTAMPTLRGLHAPGSFWLVGAFGADVDLAVNLGAQLQSFSAAPADSAIAVSHGAQLVFRLPDLPA